MTFLWRHARLAAKKRVSQRLSEAQSHMCFNPQGDTAPGSAGLSCADRYSSLAPFGRWCQKIVSQSGASTYECQMPMVSRLRNLLFLCPQFYSHGFTPAVYSRDVRCCAGSMLLHALNVHPGSGAVVCGGEMCHWPAPEQQFVLYTRLAARSRGSLAETCRKDRGGLAET